MKKLLILLQSKKTILVITLFVFIITISGGVIFYKKYTKPKVEEQITQEEVKGTQKEDNNTTPITLALPSSQEQPVATSQPNNTASVSPQTSTQLAPVPQITPPSVVASCDQSQKTALTSKYNADMTEADRVRWQLWSEAGAEYAGAGDRAREEYKDIWDISARNAFIARYIERAYSVLLGKRSSADDDYWATSTYLTLMYKANMGSIHCSI